MPKQMNRIPVLVTLFTFLVGISTVYAQKRQEPDVWMQPRESRYDTMMAVKDEITRLIAENKELEEQHSRLKEQWRAMQQNETVPDAVRLPAQQPLPRQPVRKTRINPDAMHQAVQGAAPRPVAHRFVKGELMDYDESVTLLELYLADLRYQRRELELELKLRQVELQDRQRARQLEEARRQNELQAALVEESRLNEAIKRKQAELARAPQDIPRLKKENRVMELEIPALQKKIEVKEREIGILKDKLALKEKSAAPVLSKLSKEKQALEAYVTKLDNRYENLSSTVNTSLRRQERKEQLIRDIINFDKENQKLQRQITELTDKIRYHTY